MSTRSADESPVHRKMYKTPIRLVVACNLYFGSRSKRSAAARTCEARALEFARRIYPPADHAERLARLEARRTTLSETRRVTSAREARVPYGQSACGATAPGYAMLFGSAGCMRDAAIRFTSGVSHAMSQRVEGEVGAHEKRTRKGGIALRRASRHVF